MLSLDWTRPSGPLEWVSCVAPVVTQAALLPANDYASANCGIGYASCRDPLGPRTDQSTRSLIASNSDAAGPGHCFVLHLSGGQWWMMCHAWQPDAIGSVTPGRQLRLEPITWHGGRPSVHPSQSAPQPAPNLAAS